MTQSLFLFFFSITHTKESNVKKIATGLPPMNTPVSRFALTPESVVKFSSKRATPLTRPLFIYIQIIINKLRKGKLNEKKYKRNCKDKKL